MPWLRALVRCEASTSSTSPCLLDSGDLSWLQDALAKTGAIDEISCKLLEICCSVYNSTTGKDPAWEGSFSVFSAGSTLSRLSCLKDPKDDIRLHLMRNDFMLDTQKGPAEGAMVQIELTLHCNILQPHPQPFALNGKE